MSEPSKELALEIATKLIIDGPPNGHPWWTADDAESSKLEMQWATEYLVPLLDSFARRARIEALEEAAQKCKQDFDDEEVRKVVEGIPVWQIIYDRIAQLEKAGAGGESK